MGATHFGDCKAMRTRGKIYRFEKSDAAAAGKSLQLCLTLCDPMDSSTPGSSIHRSLQARVLEWGAIAFSIDLAIIDSSYFMLYMTSVAGFFHLVKCFQGLSML